MPETYAEQRERRQYELERQGRAHPPILRRMLREQYSGAEDTVETFGTRAYIRGFLAGILIKEWMEYRPPTVKRQPRFTYDALRPAAHHVNHDTYGAMYALDEHSPDL